jgi:glycosyltransferase involved in cell wall biosynthesis
MKKKKILFFISASYVSGLEVVALHLIHGLKENGCDVKCVINGWNDGVFIKKLQELGVPFHVVKLGWLYIRKPMWTLDTLLNYPKAFFQCKKIIRSFKPDIFHFCTFTSFVLLYPLIRNNTVYWLQETHLPTLKHKFIYKLLNKKARYFVAVSDHIARVLQNLAIPDQKIRLIYNGIPPVQNFSDEKEQELFNMPVLHFAIIGQVAEWKGHSTLINAVEELVRTGKNNFKVLIYGNNNNSFGNGLKKQVEEKGLTKWIEWKGFVNDQKTIYENCAVVIVPSLSEEPCSLTIIEAMSYGKGLIVSDKGGNPELIEHGKNGLIFEAGNHTQLNHCMITLLENRHAIASLAEKAKLKASCEYTDGIMVEKYLQVYNTVNK